MPTASLACAALCTEVAPGDPPPTPGLLAAIERELIETERLIELQKQKVAALSRLREAARATSPSEWPHEVAVTEYFQKFFQVSRV